MSDKIRDLIKQSMIDHQFEVRLSPEKLAKLIIEECIDILFEEAERLYSYSSDCSNMRESNDAELAAEKCIDLIATIERHFGVSA